MKIKHKLYLALLAWTLLAIPCLSYGAGGQPINASCLAAVLHFMAKHGIRMQTWPSIVITDELKHKGLWVFKGTGIVYLKPDADCGVLAHEMAHHLMHENKQPQSEMSAHRFEQHFLASQE